MEASPIPNNDMHRRRITAADLLKEKTAAIQVDRGAVKKLTVPSAHPQCPEDIAPLVNPVDRHDQQAEGGMPNDKFLLRSLPDRSME